MVINDFYLQFSERDITALIEYLKSKTDLPDETATTKFNVVVDLLHSCELNCIGCGTNAKCIFYKNSVEKQSSLDDIERMCIKIKEYALTTNKEVFVNLGGGEPFLRDDIIDIIKIFNKYFGKNGVGIDTNGALDYSYDIISEVIDYVSYIGISLNGLKEYHNWWSGIPEYNAFDKCFNTIKHLCENERNANIVEVTSVATKNNINQLPELMVELSRIGVKKYSVHRSIPVGRMALNEKIIPNSNEYLQLLIDLIKASKNIDIDFHVHHSIENIHRAILLSNNTYQQKKIGDPNKLSSIGISPEGNVVFNAWCMVGAWKQISCGNIFDSNLSLEAMLKNNESNFAKAQIASNSTNRCNGCNVLCSGGSRIAAAFHALNRLEKKEFEVNDIIEAFNTIDPACPKYEKGVISS